MRHIYTLQYCVLFRFRGKARFNTDRRSTPCHYLAVYWCRQRHYSHGRHHQFLHSHLWRHTRQGKRSVPQHTVHVHGLVAHAWSLIAGTDFFFHVLLLLGPALSDSDSIWPHASECAALNFRVVWWSVGAEISHGPFTNFVLLVAWRTRSGLMAWCAIEYIFVLRIGWNSVNWLLLTVKFVVISEIYC